MDIEELMRNARPVQQPVKRTTILHLFTYQVHELPDGGRQIDLITPDGEIIALPMTAAHANDLSGKLVAPRAAALQ